MSDEPICIEEVHYNILLAAYRAGYLVSDTKSLHIGIINEHDILLDIKELPNTEVEKIVNDMTFYINEVDCIMQYHLEDHSFSGDMTGLIRECNDFKPYIQLVDMFVEDGYDLPVPEVEFTINMRVDFFHKYIEILSSTISDSSTKYMFDLIANSSSAWLTIKNGGNVLHADMTKVMREYYAETKCIQTLKMT